MGTSTLEKKYWGLLYHSKSAWVYYGYDKYSFVADASYKLQNKLPLSYTIAEQLLLLRGRCQSIFLFLILLLCRIKKAHFLQRG